jgi:hypothetical protein
MCSHICVAAIARYGDLLLATEPQLTVHADRKQEVVSDLVALSGCQHTELVAIGIGHHHPADLALADVIPLRVSAGGRRR